MDALEGSQINHVYALPDAVDGKIGDEITDAIRTSASIHHSELTTQDPALLFFD